MGWTTDEYDELKKGDLAWCLHCERVFVFDRREVCAYENCDGADGDICSWKDFRRINQDEEVPIIGKRYPMYRPVVCAIA